VRDMEIYVREELQEKRAHLSSEVGLVDRSEQL